jgi:chromosome segregation ATPase
MLADNTVQRQIDYLGDELAKLESRVIDPREFGRLEGAVAALKAELDDVKTKQATMDAKLDQVLDKLSEAKGGWRLLMGLGGAAATLGGIITWFATHTVTVGPKP